MAPRPMAENMVVQPNSPQETNFAHNQKREVRFELPPSDRHFHPASVAKMENSKENYQRSESPSPSMPPIQRFKSSTGIRVSCDTTSPIKELNVTGNHFNETIKNFEEHRYHVSDHHVEDRRARTFQPVIHDPTLISTDGFSRHPPHNQQRVVQQIIRPQSSHSVDQPLNTQHVHPRQVIHPPLSQQTRPYPPSVVNSITTIHSGEVGGAKRILTPEELQSMVMNRKTGSASTEMMKVQDMEHCPNPFVVNASQERLHGVVTRQRDERR